MHAVKWNRAIDVSDVVYHDVYIYFAGAEKIKTYFDSKPPCKLKLLQDLFEINANDYVEIARNSEVTVR